jgi:hypothetical protein
MSSSAAMGDGGGRCRDFHQKKSINAAPGTVASETMGVWLMIPTLIPHAA